MMFAYHSSLVRRKVNSCPNVSRINSAGNPDLSFHGILGCPIKYLDPEMLLDPFEKRLHLPAAVIQVGDGYCRKDKIVGQKHECFVALGIELADTP